MGKKLIHFIICKNHSLTSNITKKNSSLFLQCSQASTAVFEWQNSIGFIALFLSRNWLAKFKAAFIDEINLSDALVWPSSRSEHPLGLDADWLATERHPDGKLGSAQHPAPQRATFSRRLECPGLRAQPPLHLYRAPTSRPRCRTSGGAVAGSPRGGRRT